MNQKKSMAFAAAALSGLLTGTATRAAVSNTSATPRGLTTAVTGHAVNLDDTTKHDCKGQNACKGQGGCTSGDNGCKGKNSCKAKGGCKTNG